MKAAQPMPVPDATAELALVHALDIGATVGPVAHGRGDPTIRFTPDGLWRATRTNEGAATLHVRRVDDELRLRAWGPGAHHAIATAPDLLGLTDNPDALVPHHRVLGAIIHRNPGLRLTRTNGTWEALLPAICEQKVTGIEARRAFRGIVRTFGQPAPGPPGLFLAPDPGVMARVPYFALHRFGLERRRAEVIRRAAALAPRLEAMTRDEAYAAMLRVPGIGPWTVAEVGRVAYGDPDAVSVGDFHVPNLVAWALAGEPRADDARMLQLLEPYRGQRGRVQRLLEAAGIAPPKFGPRMAPRDIAAI